MEGLSTPNLSTRSLSKQIANYRLVLPDDSDAFYQNPFFHRFYVASLVASKTACQMDGKDEKSVSTISQMVYGKREMG